MYLVDKNTDKILNIKETTFANITSTQKINLKEWIESNISCLNEDFLIIQKNFNEKIDLLALDKNGNLVLIKIILNDENLTWDAIKNASFCCNLTKENILNIYQNYLNFMECNLNAQTELYNFFGKDIKQVKLNSDHNQRIILLSEIFDEEILSTFRWLLHFNINMEFIKISPFEAGNNLLLSFNYVDLIEYENSIVKDKIFTDKKINTLSENTYSLHKENTDSLIRFDFWNALLDKLNSYENFGLFKSTIATKENWIESECSFSDVSYQFVITDNSIKTQFYIDKTDNKVNKFIYNELLHQRESIENRFEGPLEWNELEVINACCISYSLEDANIFSMENYEGIIDILTNSIMKLERALKNHLRDIRTKLKVQKF